MTLTFPQPQLRLQPDELIVDCFAGGGGASTGIEWALGRSPDIAINHDAEALALHAANHPHTTHYCESVWDVNPREVTKGRKVGVLWASPDCTFHSKARGGKPFRDRNKARRRRGLAWMVVRWAKAVKPRVILLENVEEWVSWGPLGENNMPDPGKKGQTFRRWVTQLENCGYVVEWRELRARDYGAPTTRKRLFLIARCDGQPIVWPQPSHGPAQDRPYRVAAECIDWSIPCPSIFDRKKPLAENTMKRIARGLKRYVIDNPQPFIVPLTHHGDSRIHDLDDPFPTVTGAHRGELALVTPYIGRLGQTGGNGKYVNGVDEPLSTVTTQAEHLVIAPVLVQSGYGEREGQAPRVLDLQQPLGTVMAEGVKHALVSFLAKHFGDRGQAPGSELDEPLGTVTAVDHHSLVAVHLQQDYGRSIGSSASEPVPTVTAGGGGHQALVASHLVKLRGSLEHRQNSSQSLNEPFPTLTASGTHVGQVCAFLIKYFGTDQDPRLEDPLHTITTKDRFGLVTVQGELWEIVDIGMRMLSPRELYRAQGFKDSYKIAIQHNGKPLSKTAQVRMCGNSVSPVMAEALVRANVGALPQRDTRPGAQLGFFSASA